MDYSKPSLIVISGPNGAGKSTHIQMMLPSEFGNIYSFDRDKTRIEFANQLAVEGVNSHDIPLRSTRMMEELLVQEMKQAINSRNHFVLETPLSHPDYWRYIDLFENNGYQIQLNYLCLDKVSNCIARVDQRVIEGGHYVDPGTIKGVYQKNLEHINEYFKTFKVIALYDGMNEPALLVRIEDNLVTAAVGLALTKSWIKKGLPSIAQIIQTYLHSQK
jgi:predicted ABC-type ATPase